MTSGVSEPANCLGVLAGVPAGVEGEEGVSGVSALSRGFFRLLAALRVLEKFKTCEHANCGRKKKTENDVVDSHCKIISFNIR